MQKSGINERNGRNGTHTAEPAAQALGVVVRGSLTDGLEMRLDEAKSVEDLRVGQFVVVRGERNQYFAMLNDVRLDAAHPGILHSPPQGDLARAVIAGTGTFGTVKLRPMLMTPIRRIFGAHSFLW